MGKQSTGWFKVDRALIGSDLWARPLALRVYLLVLARVNHQVKQRNGFSYLAGSWTTCRAEIAETLAEVKNRQIKTPSVKRVRAALEYLQTAGWIQVEPVKRTTRADPTKRTWAHVGIRICLVKSESYMAKKSDLGRPPDPNQGTIRRTREVSSKEEHRGTRETPAPPFGSPSGGLGIERAGAPPTRPPEPDRAEMEALTARLGLPAWAIRWLERSWPEKLYGDGDGLTDSERREIIRAARLSGFSGEKARAGRG